MVSERITFAILQISDCLHEEINQTIVLCTIDVLVRR